ncbi:uncharacterized protein MONOS_10862 [Monocercomonoides exilis]|uniref:uncharacterized protein n=1 Tax=Monocercomonoides exilis TaxID=2049356 RepID=UPI0035594147|nr:hypothetical protein MONOS_10862 [Monocercomonoides exilis]|eukprot:MONOS_10862.1-p1 / transcript=MONOS_10862.1 / gene=MONOS_10862 / organism=Monocercomonoides_exilis_PA203 / gene_product=unspecified product / transcript_product=unspecified product / location=Mono_scaffold00512:34296-34847(-) / protein_length=162 / sequence_SO=supercontig / SO=protein_coding / is_pseudo=false
MCRAEYKGSGRGCLGRGCCVEEKREGLGKGGEKREGRYRLVDVKVVRKRKKKEGGGKEGGGGVVPVVVAECEHQQLSGSRGCFWEAAERREEGAWHMGGMEVRRREGGGGECSGARACAGAAEPAGAEGHEVFLYWCLPLRIVRLRINERVIVHAQEKGNA